MMIYTETKVKFLPVLVMCVCVCMMKECNGAQNVASFDMVASESASQFSEKWLASSKMYINF